MKLPIIRTIASDDAILEGDIKTAQKYLGSKYQLSGKVVGGRKIGTKIGFPTANIEIEEDYKLIPKDGVYAVEVEIDMHSYTGMLNIGKRPTIKGKHRTIEVNIFDFEAEIYNHSIKLYFIDRIRDEKKFDSLEDLKNQLSLDMLKTKEIFQK